MSVLDLARADIRALTPYSSARMEASGGRVLLNANELPWAPSAGAGEGLNRYPDPQPRLLLEQLAALYAVKADQILVGRGSDEAIDLLVRAFCRAGDDAILISPPTFGMYAVAAAIQGAAVVSAPLTDGFRLDIDALLSAMTPSVKLVFVCTPNNPSGNLVPFEMLERLASALSGRALLVVDEAYLEFSGARSAVELLGAHDHVAVLRTLSKAYGLAGARIGALLAAPVVVGLLRRIIAPYPLPAASVDAALAATSAAGVEEAQARIALVRDQRELLRAAFARMPDVLEVLPSSANFLCVRWRDAAAVYATLLSTGVVVRDVTRYRGLAGCLRVSVGTPEENALLLAALSRREEAA